MKRKVLLINEKQLQEAKKILDKNNINFYEAGFPNGTVQIIKKYESKMNNTYDSLNEYAKSIGFKDVAEAISKIGSGRKFRQQFNKDFTTD